MAMSRIGNDIRLWEKSQIPVGTGVCIYIITVWDNFSLHPKFEDT